MKKLLMKPIMHYFCDACKKEIDDGWVTYTFGSGFETHSCTRQECREIASNIPEHTLKVQK